MNNVLLWIAGLLVAALGALFAVPHFVDWNRYRGVFEEEATRMLGRDVRVAGQVNLRLLPFPFVSFERIRIADVESGAGEPFLRAEDLTIWLAVAPILRGAIQANEVALKQPTLKLRVAANGGGNWQKLSVTQGSLPFIPSDVSLDRIRVIDGTVVLQDSSGRELTRIDGISGEAQAPAIEGPYRFRADFRWQGEQREVKGTTAKRDPDGSVRLKASVRMPATGGSYAIDGRIVDPAGATRLEGDLTAKLPVAGGSQKKSAAEPAAFDLTSRLTMDARSLRLDNVTLTMLQGDRQQSVSGRGAARWDGGSAVTFEARSAWLDLDQIVPAGTTPAAAIIGLVEAVTARLPAAGRVEGTLAADQLNLAGEAISAARLRITRDGEGELTLRELAGALPGGTRFTATGSIAKDAVKPSDSARRPGETGSMANRAPLARFVGDVSIRGANFGRFISWLNQPVGGPAAPRNATGRLESAFGMHGRLRLDPSVIEVTGLQAELAGSAASGRMSLERGQNRFLSIMLEGNRIDLSSVLPGSLSHEGLWALVATDARKPAAAAPAAKTADPADDLLAAILARSEVGRGDMALRLRVGSLSDGRRELRDLAADLAVKNGQLQITDLRFVSGAGLALEMQGDLRGDANRASGRLLGVATVPTQAAAADLLSLIGKDEDLSRLGLALTTLGRLRAAYDLRLGQRGQSSLDLTADGMIADAPTHAKIQLDGGLADWRKSPIDIGLTMERAPLDRVLGALRILSQRDASSQRSGASATPAAGRVLLRAAGPRAQALATFLTLETQNDDRLLITGDADLGTVDAERFVGRVDVGTSDGGRALARLGLRPIPGTQGLPINGPIVLEATRAGWTMEPRSLQMGDASVSGRIGGKIKSETTEINGTISATKLTTAALLAPALAAPAGSTAENSGGAVPDLPFDFSALAGWQGRLRIETPTLLYGTAAVSSAIVDVEIADNRLEIVKLDGRVLEGALSAAIKLTRATAGADLAGTLRVTSARLDALAPSSGQETGGSSGGAGGAGTANIGLAFSGRALTPRALLAALTGKGEVQLSGGQLRGLSTSAVVALAEQSLDPKRPYQPGETKRLIAERLAQSRTSFRALRVPVEVAEGAARIAAFSIDTAEGRISNRTTIDLAELKADSEWRLEFKPVQDMAALPPISLVYSGTAANILAVAPRLQTDQLERELSVRRMEREVEELARIRKRDEERARVEQERRTEAERATRQAATPPAGGAAGVAQPAQTAAPLSAPSQAAASQASTIPTPPTPADQSSRTSLQTSLQPATMPPVTSATTPAGGPGEPPPVEATRSPSTTAPSEAPAPGTRQTSSPDLPRRPATSAGPTYVKKSPQAILEGLNSNSR